MSDQKKYMTETDQHAFDGMSVRDKPDDGYGAVCPRCKGHGGWHLTLNAYGPDKHFDASCGACWGWGYLRDGQTCAHEWGAPVTEEDRNGKYFGNCETPWKCKLCGEVIVVDSSD